MRSTSPASVPQFVKLPRTSDRRQNSYAHLKLLTGIRETSGWVLFDGKLLGPGGLIETASLPDHPVLLECAGQIPGSTTRDWLWILWALTPSYEWREVARAQGPDNSAVRILREPALAAMNPNPELYEVSERAQQLATSAVHAIDATVAGETADVKVRALHAIYDQIAGRIASVLG